MKAISFKVFHGYTLIGYLTFLSIIGSSFDVLCQGFGDNRLLFSINPESYFSLRYSYDSIQDKHSMKLNRGVSQIFSPSILSIVDSLQCIGGIYNSLWL